MTHLRPERKARTVALVGVVFQVALAVSFIFLTAWTASEASRGLMLLTWMGVPVWLALAFVYHQRVLVQDEAFESEQLRRERERVGSGEAIFDVEEEQLLLARRRLGWMYGWLVPAFSLVTILALILAALVKWSWRFGESLESPAWAQPLHTSLAIWFVGGAAFLSFLYSRYVTGMARHPEWQMLRSGASYLMGVTLSAVGLAATLATLHFFKTPLPERVLAYVLRILLLVLAGEFGLNFVLDFYRPRAPQEEPRPAFDSRLLGLFSEPGGIARSIAEAINYQFGFEVSSTWFYKLLQRSIVPLIGFAVATLFLASSLVFVNADEQGVVERFGVVRRDAEDRPALLEPGLHVKWPWPVDVVRKVATRRVHEMRIGIEAAEGTAKKDEKGKKEELILWTNKHEQEPHLQVLVATPKLAAYLTGPGEGEAGRAKPRATGPAERPPAPARPAATAATSPAAIGAAREGSLGEAGEAVPVSILRVAVSIQYMIRDAYDWVTTYAAPQRMLEAIANREIMRYCASADVKGLLGEQRGPIEKRLWETVQQAADREKLGVDILFLGLQGVHPPESVADSFQDVIGAEQKSRAAVRSAEADYKKRLSEATGDFQLAQRLADAIREMTRLEGDANASEPQREDARKRVETLFDGDPDAGVPGVGGQASQRLVQGRAKRWQLQNQAAGEALAFEAEMATKNAAPAVYYLRKYLDAMAESTKGIRKYVLTGRDQATVGTFHLNLQDPLTAPIDLEPEPKP